MSPKDFKATLSSMDRILKENLKRDTVKLIKVMKQLDLTNIIEHCILKQKNTPSSQHLMVPSPKLTV